MKLNEFCYHLLSKSFALRFKVFALVSVLNMTFSLTAINERNKILMKAFLFVAILIGLVTGPAIALWKAVIILFVLYLITGGYRFAYIFYRTVGRDLK